MSVLIRTLLEAETISAREYMRAAVMREEGLRAAMRAASQASLARKTALRQEPGRQEPGRQEPSTPRDPVSGNRHPDPSLTNHGAAGGRSEVRAVGRARPAKPIRSTKSAIVPEPDQIRSAPPVRPTLPHRT
jgi:hypothetical protein